MAKFREEDVLAGKFQSPGARPRMLINKAFAPAVPVAIRPDEKWTAQAAEDAKQGPPHLRLRRRHTEQGGLRYHPARIARWLVDPLHACRRRYRTLALNYTGVRRSQDQGRTWTPLERFDVGFPREGKTVGQGPTELFNRDGRSTFFFSTHSKHWANDWRSWFLTSDDSFKTWSKPSVRYRAA